jgi:diadenosine tetraphosphate (Ap4A) HIT family hydrolase
MNKNAVCFYHPVPMYQPHVLIVPRRIIQSIVNAGDGSLYRDILSVADTLSNKSPLDNQRLMLRVNCGSRQEVNQVHFHLYPVSDTIDYSKILSLNVQLSGSYERIRNLVKTCNLEGQGFSLFFLKESCESKFQRTIYLDF